MVKEYFSWYNRAGRAGGDDMVCILVLISSETNFDKFCISPRPMRGFGVRSSLSPTVYVSVAAFRYEWKRLDWRRCLAYRSKNATAMPPLRFHAGSGKVQKQRGAAEGFKNIILLYC